jgi:hypothetical protein
MSTPLIDISPIMNTIVGLLGPLISLVLTIQIFRLVLDLLTRTIGGLGGAGEVRCRRQSSISAR